MSSPENIKISFWKESNKLVGTVNFLGWKNKIDLLLKENELLDYIKWCASVPTKEKTQALANFNKDETKS